MMPYIRNLHVHEFSEILSDAHCPVTLQIQFKAQAYHLQTEILNDTGIDQKHSSWDKNKYDEFIQNIDQAKKSPRTSSIVQVMFSFWFFEISEDIMRNQKFIIG